MSDIITYTPGQVSQMLEIPPSSLRRYSSEFADHLSDYAKVRGKKRRYTDDDVLLLGRIRKLTRQKLSHDEIAAAMYVQEEETTSALALMPEVLEVFEEFRARITEQAAQMDALRQQLDETQARLEQLEKPWYQKIFKRGEK